MGRSRTSPDAISGGALGQTFVEGVRGLYPAKFYVGTDLTICGFSNDGAFNIAAWLVKGKDGKEYFWVRNASEFGDVGGYALIPHNFSKPYPEVDEAYTAVPKEEVVSLRVHREYGDARLHIWLVLKDGRLAQTFQVKGTKGLKAFVEYKPDPASMWKWTQERLALRERMAKMSVDELKDLAMGRAKDKSQLYEPLNELVRRKVITREQADKAVNFRMGVTGGETL
jgi:hypothetical protein